MTTYIKKDLVDRVVERTAVRHTDSARVIDALFTSLREILAEAGPDCRIEIRDFGVFEVKMTKAKPKARNPRTNEIFYVPPRRKTHFRPGKLLKEALRRPMAEAPAAARPQDLEPTSV